jgi:CDP-paratose 2-epimerase
MPELVTLTRPTRMTEGLEASLGGATVLVTGGAGFVGSWVSTAIAREVPSARVVALDNLQRRGSALHLPELEASGVRFVHGDVRNADDVNNAVDDCDVIVDCAAEASASAGYLDPPDRVVSTNLVGAIHCLAKARRHRARVVFLSTSRVYPIAPLNDIAVVDEASRWSIAADQSEPGVSREGINERFTLGGLRTLYGATKLATELLLAEYAAMYGFSYVVNRLGRPLRVRGAVRAAREMARAPRLFARADRAPRRRARAT